MSKSTRSKLFSIYLRPWTLLETLATAEVPYLKNLFPHSGSTSSAGSSADIPTQWKDESDARQGWKHYLANVLPHARRQLGNFMLASIAEGRNHDNEEEGAFRRGATLRCALTPEDIANVTKYVMKKGHEDANAAEDTNPKKKNPTGQRMAATASLAMQLASATKIEAATTGTTDTLTMHSYEKPDVARDTASSNSMQTEPTTMIFKEHNWSAAYVSWRAQLYNEELNEGIIPNEKQGYILQCVHDRCVEEATKPNEESTAPFLRFVHGLPGSGKSKLLEWLRSYYQEVW